MTLIKNIWNVFFSKKQHPFNIEITENVPFHIKEIAKLYPILHLVANNRAVGEIAKFEFNHENVLRTGQAIIINGKQGMVSTWVHLGNDFFKLIMKA